MMQTALKNHNSRAEHRFGEAVRYVQGLSFVSNYHFRLPHLQLFTPSAFSQPQSLWFYAFEPTQMGL